MQEETHETSCDDGVTNPEVPRCPLRLEPVELAEVGVCV